MAPYVRGLGILLVLLLTCAGVRDASAHASLVKAEPADGAVLAAPPATLRLTFNEPVSPLVFRLLGPNGAVVNTGVAAADAVVTLTPPRLQRGTHVLNWRVISADGHPVGGALMFSVGAPSGRPADATPQGDLAVRAALWTAKVVIYIGLFVGIGGAFFRAWIADPAAPTPRGPLIGALFVGLLALPHSVCFQGLDALDLPLTDALRPLPWAAGIDTSYGNTAIAAALALLAGLGSVIVRRRAIARALSLIGLCGAALALALSGHAATAPPRLLTMPSVVLHVVGVAFWVGALVPLIAAARAADFAGFARFSRLIPYALVGIVLTGSALAVVQLDRIDALWSTNYGLVLSGKLAAVLVLLALGALNRYRLVPRFETGGVARAAPLVASIAAEIVLAGLILALVALWRFTPPPRAMAAVQSTSIHFHGERAMAQIEVEPVRARGAEVTVQVLDGEFRPLTVKEVTLAFSNPSAGIEPMRRTATAQGDVLWRIDDLRIPVAGRWRLRVEILISDFDKVVLEDDVVLPRSP